MSTSDFNKVLSEIRSLTPNHPDYKIEREKTFTQKQWQYNMNLSNMKENLRKKSTRLSKKSEEIVTSFDDLDRLLNIESKTVYTKSWNRLSRQFKINRLMDYYDRPMTDIVNVYGKLKDRDVEYDEKEGKITHISVNLFENA